MSKTLREIYVLQKLKEGCSGINKADSMLKEHLEYRRALDSSNATLIESIERAERFLEAKMTKKEAEEIASAIERLQKLVRTFGGKDGQLPNISTMIKGIVDSLKNTGAKGGSLMDKLAPGSTSLARAAALEGLLKSGFELVPAIIRQGGEELKQEEPLNTQPGGKNVVAALARAFDPGRTTSLAQGLGAKISQLFNTRGSIGTIIANDLANLNPRQLGGFSDEVTKTVPMNPKTVDDAVSSSPSASPEKRPEQAEKKAAEAPPANERPGVAQAATPAQAQTRASASAEGQSGPPVPSEEHLDPKFVQNKAGVEMGKMSSALTKKNQKAALFYAAQAMQKLGINAKQALSDYEKDAQSLKSE